MKSGAENTAGANETQREKPAWNSRPVPGTARNPGRFTCVLSSIVVLSHTRTRARTFRKAYQNGRQSVRRRAGGGEERNAQNANEIVKCRKAAQRTGRGQKYAVQKPCPAQRCECRPGRRETPAFLHTFFHLFRILSGTPHFLQNLPKR